MLASCWSSNINNARKSKTMKTDIQTIIAVIIATWIITSIALGWLLLASEKRHKARQKHYDLIEKWLDEAAK